MLYRYSRWDGSQENESPSAEDLMNNVADDLMESGDLRDALRRMLRWGTTGPNGQEYPGLEALREQLKAHREQQLERYDLGSLMDDIKERLEKVLATERAGIQHRLDQANQPQSPLAPPEPDGSAGDQPSGDQVGDQQPTDNQSASDQQAATESGGQSESGRQISGQSDPGPQSSGQRESGQQPGAGQPSQQPGANVDPRLRKMLEKIAGQKRQFLDQLPPDTAGQIKSLSDYDFMDQDARQQFQELLKMLQQQMLGNQFEGLKKGIESLKPEDLQRMREMVRDFNQMLQDKQRGGNPDFGEFMSKHGQFFPPGINSLDELVEHMQRRSAQMQSLLNSMTPEMRKSLQDLTNSLFQDDRLKWDLLQLAVNLEKLMPQKQFQNRYPFSGEEDLSLAEAMKLMDQLQQIDGLMRQLRQADSPEALEDIDAAKIAELLGKEAADQLEQLRQLTKILEEAGYLQKKGERFELTARGIRQIGQKALTDIFGKLSKDAFGKHEIDYRGIGGERGDETKPYEFGDPFHLDLNETLMNSLTREGAGTPVKLHPDDFVVYRTEHQTQSAIVLMVDMSRSMILRGCFGAAKKVALALNSLIRGQYPNDSLDIVLFSEYARSVPAETIPELSWDEETYGTNLQHGLMIARQLLARHKGANKQIIVITDGEPTAHLEDGIAQFNYPPTTRTVLETLREVERCTKERIVINTFMLERSSQFVDFVNRVTRINRGRAFFATPERLGEYILVDYVASKKKRIA